MLFVWPLQFIIPWVCVGALSVPISRIYVGKASEPSRSNPIFRFNIVASVGSTQEGHLTAGTVGEPLQYNIPGYCALIAAGLVLIWVIPGIFSARVR